MQTNRLIDQSLDRSRSARVTRTSWIQNTTVNNHDDEQISLPETGATQPVRLPAGLLILLQLVRLTGCDRARGHLNALHLDGSRPVWLCPQTNQNIHVAVSLAW
jgi:hypothetical protein